jgi:predicted acyltransferase
MDAAPQRIESLDMLRGLTVAAMILVNHPGDWNTVFPPLLHAYWTGWTFADLIFPAFIFIVGAAMPLAFARRRARGASIAEVYWRVVRRAMVLIVLGLLLNAAAGSADAALRWPGVLQRIALTQLIAFPIVLHFDVRAWVVVAAALLVLHWALLVVVPFGGFPAGTLTPEHNLARFVDTQVLGAHALTIPNDPEGLLGTLPAAATALLGAAAGDLLRRMPAAGGRARALVAFGAASFGAGILWSQAFPPSKPLWTGSFALIAAGLTSIALAATDIAIAIRWLGAWSRPFVWLGVNALALYFCSEMLGRAIDRPWLSNDGTVTTVKTWLYWTWFEPAFRPRSELASFAFAASLVALWSIVAGTLYRFRVRIPV